MPSSLFGRAVVWARKGGDRAMLDTDAVAAAKIDPQIRADFEGYEVRL